MRFLSTPERPNRTVPAVLIGGYVVVSALWILVTVHLEDTTRRSVLWRTANGLAFVVITGALLYILAARFLRQSTKAELMLRRLFEEAQVGLCLNDLTPAVVDCNQAMARLLGYTREELIGKRFEQFIHPDDLATAQKQWESMKEENGPARFATDRQYVTKDGGTVWARLSVSKVDLGNQKDFWIGIAQDITSQVVAFQALHENELEMSRLALAVESAHESIVITDLNANIVYVNPAFERLSGYSKKEVIGQSAGIQQSGKTSKQTIQAVWTAMKNGETWQGHFINRRKDGSDYLEEATVSPVRDRSGKIINYIAVKRDITRESELEQQLLQSQKMEALGQLAGGIIHDLNNFLQVIHSSAELGIRRVDDHAYVEQKLEAVLQMSKRGSEIISQLLAFGRREAAIPRRVDLNGVLAESDKMIRRLLNQSIEFDLQLSSESAFIMMDPVQIVQVLANLAINARDAMPNGGRLLVTTGRRQKPSGDVVQLTVADTGVGMDASIKAKVFQPFFTTKEPGKGTGLGLSMVRRIVEQNRGTISFESEPGRGTRFELQFPLCAPANAHVAVSKLS